MFEMRTPVRSFARFAALGLFAALTACADMTPDYRENHPIQVSQQPLTMAVGLPAEGADFAAEDLARLSEFADVFIKKGDSVLEIAVNADPDEAAAKERAKGLSDLLVGMGLRADEIAVRVGAASQDGEAGTALLSFLGYVAVVPECRDWAESSSFEYWNGPSQGYGCSQQRNIGLMVANPRDLLQRRPSEPRVGAVGAGVAGKYNTATDTRNATTVSGAVAAQSQGQSTGN